VQISVGKVDPVSGKYTGESTTFAISGFIREKVGWFPWVRMTFLAHALARGCNGMEFSSIASVGTEIAPCVFRACMCFPVYTRSLRVTTHSACHWFMGLSLTIRSLQGESDMAISALVAAAEKRS
jgi:hypothetical protein